MGSLEKLGEIDLELDSFGKTEELLGGVMRLAREHAPQGLEAIDVALAELGVAVPTEVRRRVETVLPVGGDAKPGTWERPERTEPFPDEGSGLVDVPEEVLRAEPLPAVLELDPEILGASPQPAPAEQVQLEQVQLEQMQAEQPSTEPTSFEAAQAEPESFDLTVDAFDDTTDIRDPQSLETEILVAEEHDTGEMALASSASSEVAVTRDAPLADLFDDVLPASDVPPSSPPEGAPLSNLFDDSLASDLFDDSLALEQGGAPIDGGLADLFDESVRPEAEPAAHEDLSDLLSTELRSAMDESELGSLEEDEPEQTAIFTADEVRALRSSPPPDVEDGSLDAQLDALVGEPIEDASSSDDFELMIDEDVLALEDAEREDAELEGDPAATAEGIARPSQAPGSPSQPPKGFFSRILNRK